MLPVPVPVTIRYHGGRPLSTATCKSGTQHADSDLDIGLYYAEADPFSVDAIRRIAVGAAEPDGATVTDFYEWGAWVNGGAWIRTRQGKVDFLYRNADQVQRTIDEAHAGRWQHDYSQQPTHGFYSVIYLAEAHICRPLYDPGGVIAELKSRVECYPPELKRAIISSSLWSAEFTLLFARDYARGGDVYNTVGCLTRVAAALTQALFALNEVYFIRDKQVMQTIDAFVRVPDGYAATVSSLLGMPGTRAAELEESVDRLRALWQSVVALEGVDYAPRY